MDLQDIDQEADAAAMAEMLGFTAFGSQAPPSKKRRYNPRADAIAATGPGGGGGLPPNPTAPRGTGANTLPLLPRGARGEGADAGAAQGHGVEPEQRDRRVLDRTDGAEAVGPGTTGSAGGDGRGGAADGEDPEPQYIDTSQSPIRTGPDDAASALSTADAHDLSGHRPAGRGDRGRDGGGGGPGKRIWWTDYYDPSSNENPWEWLEKARGLDPVGSWLPRGHGRNRAGGGRPD